MATVSGKLFVGGISQPTSAEILRDHFSKYGKLKEYEVIRDRITRQSRGFGFVAFADPSLADRALEEDHIILGRKVEVRLAKPKEEYSNQWQLQRNQTSQIVGCNTHVNKRKIFVGGLPHNLTDGELKSYFDSFGTVVDAVVIHDKEYNKPRGFGFVTFDSEEAVESVLKRSFHKLNNRRVEVKRAVPKEDMSNMHKLSSNNLRVAFNDINSANKCIYNTYMDGRSGPMCSPTNFGAYTSHHWPYVDSFYGDLNFYANPLFYPTCLNCGVSYGWVSTSRPDSTFYSTHMSQLHHAIKLESNVVENQNGANQKESNANEVGKECKVVGSHKKSYADGKCR
ncbi:hypothetical protein LguiA_006007 [Lonicera macranthoides]